MSDILEEAKKHNKEGGMIAYAPRRIGGVEMKTCYVCNCEIKQGDPFFNRMDGGVPAQVHDDCLLRQAEFSSPWATKEVERLREKTPWNPPPAQATPSPPVPAIKPTWRLEVIRGGFWLDSAAKKPNWIRRLFYKWLLGWRVLDL